MILTYLALAWLAGVVVAALGFTTYWPLALLGGAGVCLGLVLSRKPRLAAGVALLVVVAVAGLARYEGSQSSRSLGGIVELNDGKPAVLRGVVIEEPEERDTSQRLHLRVEAREIGGAWEDFDGRVLVTARLFPRFEYGDVLELRGKLQTPPSFEDFDYREYLARQGIGSLSAYPSLRRVGAGEGSDAVRLIGGRRRPLGESLERSLPEPESALSRGMLLGQRASIPRDLTDEFNRAGISHLIAISGYNVMILAGFAQAGLSWLLGKRQATALSMLLVVVFALFVGPTPSVLRAVFMAQVVLGATIAGRPNSARGAVLLAGAALTAWQPSIIDDVSFQLSFGATLGIVLLARPLQARLESITTGVPLLRALAEPAAVTLAATLATEPIIAASFGRVSLVSLPANLLALPAFPIVLATSALTAMAGVIDAGLGRLAGEVAYLPLAYLVWLARSASGLPSASLTLQALGTLEAALLYAATAVIALLMLRTWRPADGAPERTLRLRPVSYLSVVVLVLGVFVWRDALAGEERRLRVSVLDVGQGDSILIETPAGQRILVDGGPSGNRLKQQLGEALPASARRFDLVVLTHGQDDHVTGLIDLLDGYDVRAVLASPLPGTSAAYREWRETLDRRGVPLREAVAGEWLDLGEGVRLEVLGPPVKLLKGTQDDMNNSSVILRLVYGEIIFLLTGDLAAEGEAAVMQTAGDLHATVLKAGHHGSDTSSTTPFLAAVKPKLTVISVGADNNYGHPSPTTRLRFAGVPVLRTDENGRVRLSTNGRRLFVETERGSFSIVRR